jgi:hypothetical protein
MLIWRTHEIIAEETETVMNTSVPLKLDSHEKVREKKQKILLRHMYSLRSLIAPFDPDDDSSEEESMDEEYERVVTPQGIPVVSPSEQVERICKGSLNIPGRKLNLKTEEQRREEEAAKKNRAEERKKQTFLNNMQTPEEVEDICKAVWADPREDKRLREAWTALREACTTKTLVGNPKDEDKSIKQADALRNRSEWALDKKDTYLRMILTDGAPSWMQRI